MRRQPQQSPSAAEASLNRRPFPDPQRRGSSSPSAGLPVSSRRGVTPNVLDPGRRFTSPPSSNTSPPRYAQQSTTCFPLFKFFFFFFENCWNLPRFWCFDLLNTRFWSSPETQRGITRRTGLFRGIFSWRWGTMRSWVSFWAAWPLQTAAFCRKFIRHCCRRSLPPAKGRGKSVLLLRNFRNLLCF